MERSAISFIEEDVVFFDKLKLPPKAAVFLLALIVKKTRFVIKS